MRSRTRAFRSLSLLPLAVVALLVSLMSFPAQAAEDKYAAIVFDANSGKTLFQRNAEAQRYPASLTKMMTLYVLFEELDAGRLTLTTPLPVSAVAARQAPSKLGLKPGQTIKVEDAILALVTKSANDAAVVVAEGVGGSVSGFADRMNRTARALGMSSTRYRNPNGLPDTGQVTTAHDLIRLALALQDRFPKYYPYFATRSFSYRGARHGNHNRLLGSVAGVDGIKTGYTRASGFNLVTNVERDGRHVIAVVMGGKTASSRDAHMRELIAKYLPKAKKGSRATPLLIAETGPGGVAVAEAQSRKPRARPEGSDADALAYAVDEDDNDDSSVVGEAMAELEANTVEVDDEEPEASSKDDPIALRIASASSVAEFADITIEQGDGDPIARLTQLARIRAGVADVVAAGPEQRKPDGWYIQIGAVPTEDGATELLEKAQASLGSVLATRQPMTEEVTHKGTTLYRARFAGFVGKDDARDTCSKLKSKAFSCLAVPN